MTEEAVTSMHAGSVGEDAPPPGTAIVRPLRHVKAVRERQAPQLVERSGAIESRSARAWAWALGEAAAAPVTDQMTAVPPSRADIEAEIAIADERRLRGDCEKRADAAATILRWLIGEDDRIPVRGENRGELVGGFGDVVRSPDQINAVLDDLTERRHRMVAGTLDSLSARRRRAELDSGDYLDGVTATLSWVLRRRPSAPISGVRALELTTRDLKTERLYAEDVIEQSGHQGSDRLQQPPTYGLGVRRSIDWLLGDATKVDSVL